MADDYQQRYLVALVECSPSWTPVLASQPDRFKVKKILARNLSLDDANKIAQQQNETIIQSGQRGQWAMVFPPEAVNDASSSP